MYFSLQCNAVSGEELLFPELAGTTKIMGGNKIKVNNILLMILSLWPLKALNIEAYLKTGLPALLYDYRTDF
jgi:hypothetical protein